MNNIYIAYLESGKKRVKIVEQIGSTIVLGKVLQPCQLLNDENKIVSQQVYFINNCNLTPIFQ